MKDARKSDESRRPPRARLEKLRWEYRRVLPYQRDAARVISGATLSRPNRLCLTDTGLGMLLQAGFVEAFVRQEVRKAAVRSEAPAEAYLNMVLVAPLVPDADRTGRLRFGLKTILDGLERQLAPA